MTIPKEVQRILEDLRDASFEAHTVGGCVRDLLLNKDPQDWDVTTNAKPPEIQSLFSKHFYNNRFGTVTVLTKSPDPQLQEIEITTYRTEETYSDQRHPDVVSFTSSLKEDLARRDFTINAMALDEKHVVDPFNGQKDLEKKIIRAVGNPEQRFAEDALRLIRAVRFAAQLGFEIEQKTRKALERHAGDIRNVSWERIRDEFTKIIMSDNAEQGIILLSKTSILSYIIPELAEGVGVKQSKHHIYPVFDHAVKSLGFSARENDPLHTRLAVLFHDIGKPQTKEGKDPNATFHGHDVVGAAITRRVLRRLRYPEKIIRKVVHLVRHHMFMYDIGVVTDAGVRRLLHRVGPENFKDLITIRMRERLGSGVPKARPYRLRHLEYMAEKVQQDPISVKMLAINGTDLIQKADFAHGPEIGAVLDVLLSEVIEDPKKNTGDYLINRSKKLRGKDLSSLRAAARDIITEKQCGDEEQIKRKYHIQ